MVVTKAGSDYCKVFSKTIEGEKGEIDKVTVSLAAATEISTDAAVATV